jgi:hypothetical protein
VTVYHQVLASEATEFQNNMSATTAAPTTAPEPKSSLHTLPFCIYAQSRGWGNSILAVFNFLERTLNTQHQLQEDGLIDLPTSQPCSGNTSIENNNETCVNFHVSSKKLTIGMLVVVIDHLQLLWVQHIPIFLFI